MKNGFVYIAGAGPGNMGLVTLRLIEIIQKVDVIVYDRLINKRLINYAKPDCTLIYLGKGNTEGGEIQDEINRTLVNYSLQGKSVLRLKGGDPFLFGRGGEEALVLHSEGIDFEVVPGVTSAISVPAFAGIPVTHRDFSSSLHIFTGHSKANGETLDYKTIAKLNGTLVFLMGVKNSAEISNELIKNGKSGATPVAIIKDGTTSSQKTITRTLSEIGKLSDKISPPSIIVIGEVVSLHDKLKWFDKRPLSSKKILVTRASENAKEFSSLLESFGAEVVEMPFIAFEKNDIDDVNLEQYDILLFNSANGVKYFFESLQDIRCLYKHKIGVIGSATKNEIEKYKIIPDIIPENFLGDELVTKTVGKFGEGKNILIVTSDISPVDCEKYSKMYNCKFDKLEAYKTIKLTKKEEEIKELLNMNCEIITFMSSSTVDSFFENVGESNYGKLDNLKIASIGPETTKTILKYGFKPFYEAATYTKEGIIDSILKTEVENEKV